ncbi:MAG: HEPN domain-containing protein [Candidatus Aquicultorales bacterium]
MHKDACHWIDFAQYDMETARIMFDTERYLYVLFTCGQAIEKLLKALIIQKTGEFPPRTHDLLELAELAGVALFEEEAEFLAELTGHFIESRDPEELIVMVRDTDKEKAESCLRKSKEFFDRLKGELDQG